MALLPACKSRAALVYSLLLASACIEISRTCEGKKLMRIVTVLREIKDWKKLAMQLDMTQGDINECGSVVDMVSRFCELQGDVPVKDVVATIAEALRDIGNVKQADILEKEFQVIRSTSGIPSSPPTKKPADTVPSDSSSPPTRSPPREGSGPPPPPPQPTHILEHSVIESIKKYLINLTTEAIVIGGVFSLIVAVLLHCFCSKNKARPSPSSGDSPPSETRETKTRPPPSSGSPPSIARDERLPPPTASAGHSPPKPRNSNLRHRRLDSLSEPIFGEKVTASKLIVIKYDDDKELRITNEIAPEWKDLAELLGCFTTGYIASISKSVQRDPKEAAEKMLREWTMKDVDHTWRKLIQKMRDVQLLKTAAAELAYALRHISE